MISTTDITSNDLLLRLLSEHPHMPTNYAVIVQSAEEVQNIQNSPSISMGPYLFASEQISRLTTLSIYSLRGSSREQVRLLYMNAPALEIWLAMGMTPTVIGSVHRPPRTALLTFGVPFSE